MASSSFSPSRSSSTASRWTYDAFLNFRGEDTRFGFTSHLYNALRQSGIHAFMDDSGIGRGEQISDSLLQAIERSRIALVIFSPDYASSRWCLDELVKIMKCQRTQAQVVIPVFYEVDPSDVRHQRGTYGEAIAQHEQSLGRKSDRVRRWKAALTAAANIAGFRWCMDDVVEKMECERTGGQVIMPSYNADPSDVCQQRGTYGEAMGRENNWALLQRREALKVDAANRTGSVLANRPKSDLIQKIVEAVSEKLDDGHLFVADHPVGIGSRVDELTMEWSKTRWEKVLIIGLWGMGGLGKTTIAKAIYNKISHKFGSRSFLANIRENLKKTYEQVDLQRQLISDITKTDVFKIPDIDRGKKIIQDRFPNIRAFVVLDDVDSLNQLKALRGSLEWFCQGSVIIITTRNMRLLNVLEADYKYRIREMNEVESLELFSWHGFNQATPLEKFTKLSKKVVAYCGGLLLALEVIGSCLYERTIEEWEDLLSKLKKIPNKDIQAKLRISYDGLDDHTQKEIFLDVCCFFINKDRNYVTQILDGCRLHAKSGIQILIERSLVKIGMNNKLEIHDLLLEMGKEIIRDSPPKDPKDHSRLWSYRDILHVLTKHVGTRAIEGISLKMPRTNRGCHIGSKAFKKMNNLRLLQLDYVHLKGDYKHLSKNLRWLCWHGFPLEYIPNNIYQKKLVAIDFKYSNLKNVWYPPQYLDVLKTLNLSYSFYLRRTPNFTFLPNLEKLVLKDCSRLNLVHESIGDLKKILLVNLKGCMSLRALPRSIYKLKSLKTLILSGCLLIDHLEEDIEQMESMTIIKADYTAIKKVPKSLVRLEGLKHGYLSFRGHEGRAHDVFPSLIWSWMSPTSIRQSPSEAFSLIISSLVFSVVQNGSFHGLSPFLGDLAKLRGMWEKCPPKFRFNGNTAILLGALYRTNFMELESTPSTSQFSYMEASASFDGHDQVHNATPTNSLNSLLLQMGVCDQTNLLKNKILQGWNNGGWDDTYLPCHHQHQHWFMYKGEGRSVIFKVPRVRGRHLKTILFNVLYSSCMDNTTMPQFLINVLIINYTSATVQQRKGNWVTFHEDAKWQNIISSVHPGDHVEIVISIGPQFPVKMIAAYLIYDGSKRHRLLK